MIVTGPVTIVGKYLDEDYVESWRGRYDYARRAELGEIVCSACRKKLQTPFLMWMGVGEELFLHGECAEDWIWGLARDVHELRHVIRRTGKEGDGED